MCERVSQALSTDLLVGQFKAINKQYKDPEPSWNVAPLQSATVVVLDVKTQDRILVRMEWGLIVPREKSPDWTDFRPINARCETVALAKPFRRAFQKQRCILPVNAYCEWRITGSGKQPFAVSREDGAPMALGAICETWWRQGADRRLTFSIVTTPAGSDTADIKDRMPLVLEPADWPVWLGQERGDVSSLLRPAKSGAIRVWRVGSAIANPECNGPEILEAT